MKQRSKIKNKKIDNKIFKRTALKIKKGNLTNNKNDRGGKRW